MANQFHVGTSFVPLHIFCSHEQFLFDLEHFWNLIPRHKNKNNKNNKASFRTFERCSRSKRLFLNKTKLFLSFLGIPWTETLCLVIHVAVFNLGYGCLGYPMMAEILPPKIRTQGLALIMIIGGCFGFLNSLSFVQLESFIAQENIFLTYSGVNVLGMVYLFFWLPNVESLK